MPIPEPSDATGLWAQVRALSGWPDSDEDAIRSLAAGWANSAQGFETAAGAGATGVDAAWPDAAGAAMQDSAGQIGTVAGANAAAMREMAARAEHFADAVTHVKTGIHQLIDQNVAGYASTFTLPDGVREAAQAEFVQVLADGVNTLTEGTAQIVAQGPTGGPIDHLLNFTGDTLENVAQALQNKWYLVTASAINGGAGVLSRWHTHDPLYPSIANDFLPDARHNAQFVRTATMVGRGAGGLLSLAAIPVDMANGESLDQAIVSNSAGFLASTGTGMLIGTAIGGPIGTVVGAGVGLVAGLFAGGAVDALYENADGINAAIHDGAAAVADAAAGAGEAIGDGAEWVYHQIFG
ncbi:hypothetical protein O7627_21455 [Solwaraspora sp. WMMD1047]|uniref:WXG100-like domain-containing protein n=1 Tax=Solwaraspora sp. WMMD1047 TaxID=3016102 RepID=UPI0024161874|nr:hypothetical protein [Solwaraspora sp. WMMD1047]MDG4831851.1 hypothetical protein [Solwaraspora sp. WMMD1047]